MEFFKAKSAIDFMGQRRWAAIFSGLLFIFSLGSLIVHGLNLGLDFTGGVQMQLHYQQPANLTHIREQLDTAGLLHAGVQNYGTSHEVSIKLQPKAHEKQDQVKQAVQRALPLGKIVRMDYIGPQVGKALVTNGILAIIVSLLATMLYVAVRFDYRFGVSATVAMIHDPILVLGIFSFFHIEFNLITLAAVLTVIGYSLNDTIVVYDRVRECFRKVRKKTAIEVMNLSINQTLSRTIMTSGLTLLVVIALYLYGGEVLKPFALALMIGILIGTYSSIYVAGSLALMMGLDRNSLLPAKKVAIDDMP